MLNGTVLSKDRKAAEIRNDDVIVTDPRHCPLYLQKYNDIEGWLRGRAIDAHRTNSRLLRKALRLAPNDDLAAVLRVHGATITDPYWFLPEGGSLTYEQVRFEKMNLRRLRCMEIPILFPRVMELPERLSLPIPAALKNAGSCWTVFGGCIKPAVRQSFFQSCLSIISEECSA